MWYKIKVWFCSKLCGKTKKIETEKMLLATVAEYSLRLDVDLEVLKKISETVTTVAMREKGKLDRLQIQVLNSTLSSWANGNATPREFKSLFRGGK